jgi:subtilisin family serine protease
VTVRRLLAATVLVCALVAAPAGAAGGHPIVAVVDSGVDASHPALDGLLWRNPGETPGNGVDDDHDGFVDDLHGADFLDRDGTPQDDRGHGTHIAGMVARRPMLDRRLGRSTGARVMSLRVVGADGRGGTQALADAIFYAVEHRARVINISLAYYEPSLALTSALLFAHSRKVLVVTAAGNGHEDLDRTPVYPASYHLPGMLVVGAVVGPAIAWWSARGDTKVDIAAPADEVSTIPGNRWGKMTGTSQSAAHVSRAAALLMAARPRRSAWAVRRAILGGARPLAQLEATTATGGELDVRAALRRLRLG